MADSRRAWAGALFAACASPAPRRLIVEVLEGLSAALGEQAIRDGLEDPLVSRRLRVGLLEAALPASAPRETRELFGRFATLLVDKGCVSLLPGIATSFRELVDQAEGVVRLTIEAARQPSEADLLRLAAAWSAAGKGERIETTVRLDPSLIGGYRLRSGSIRYDHSIAGRSLRLRRHLSRPLEDPRPQPDTRPLG